MDDGIQCIRWPGYRESLNNSNKMYGPNGRQDAISNIVINFPINFKLDGIKSFHAVS